MYRCEGASRAVQARAPGEAGRCGAASRRRRRAGARCGAARGRHSSAARSGGGEPARAAPASRFACSCGTSGTLQLEFASLFEATLRKTRALTRR
ncbi:unnamed protein product [Arctia plantaginis]|uniref:Uncharacterized protein n=1 Tax=Arctia plantaginis TaxID=874455 RepID=A0A8S0ZGS4_ARCPL|nr:unnamed protein product [Arctia plantaginis]